MELNWKEKLLSFQTEIWEMWNENQWNPDTHHHLQWDDEKDQSQWSLVLNVGLNWTGAELRRNHQPPWTISSLLDPTDQSMCRRHQSQNIWKLTETSPLHDNHDNWLITTPTRPAGLVYIGLVGSREQGRFPTLTLTAVPLAGTARACSHHRNFWLTSPWQQQHPSRLNEPKQSQFRLQQEAPAQSPSHCTTGQVHALGPNMSINDSMSDCLSQAYFTRMTNHTTADLLAFTQHIRSSFSHIFIIDKHQFKHLNEAFSKCWWWSNEQMFKNLVKLWVSEEFSPLILHRSKGQVALIIEQLTVS